MFPPPRSLPCLLPRLCRSLHLPEHASLALLSSFGAATQRGAPAATKGEAGDVARGLLERSPGCDLVVKVRTRSPVPSHSVA